MSSIKINGEEIEPVTVTVILPTKAQAMALAQMCKRFGWSDAQRLASHFDGGKELDNMIDAMSILRQSLRDAGYAPR